MISLFFCLMLVVMSATCGSSNKKLFFLLPDITIWSWINEIVNIFSYSLSFFQMPNTLVLTGIVFFQIEVVLELSMEHMWMQLVVLAV